MKAIREEQIQQLRRSARLLASSTIDERNEILSLIAEGLRRDWKTIKAANDQDIAQATAEGLGLAMIKRLSYSPSKLEETLAGIEDVKAQADPIGTVRQRRMLDDGLLLEQISVPIGVIGMIFEARPDALVQIIALSAKSGNGIILKGGSEAQRTNVALTASIERSLEKSPVGSQWLLLLESRSDVGVILSMEEEIDLLIPRGSKEFVRYIMDNTTIPVLGHADGICHLYIDESADLQMAQRIAFDSKTQYPAACNAVETILVHQRIAARFLPALAEQLSEAGVVIHGDSKASEIIECTPYQDGDWQTEYLDLEVNIKIVASLDEAIEHIERWGSHHTDGIVSSDEEAIRTFFTQVDSADVFANCSTRFADGYRFGLGAEVGISTQRIHARGPVGVEGLLSTKYLLRGTGQRVADYSGSDARPFTHEELPLGGPSMGERNA